MSDFTLELKRVILLAAETVPLWADAAVIVLIALVVGALILLTSADLVAQSSADERTDD